MERAENLKCLWNTNIRRDRKCPTFQETYDAALLWLCWEGVAGLRLDAVEDVAALGVSCVGELEANGATCGELRHKSDAKTAKMSTSPIIQPNLRTSNLDSARTTLSSGTCVIYNCKAQTCS